MGKEVARRYLRELESMGSSGKVGFLSFLQSELQTDPTPKIATQPTDDQNVDTATHYSDRSEPVEPSSAFSPKKVCMDESLYNPLHVQKVVVEHIVRNEPTYTSHTRIRTFSGRIPRPNGEVDYETWRSQVDLLLSDSSLTDAHKVRRILESLLSPASEIVKPLGVAAPPNAYVDQLESAFGVVEDGEELFTSFLCSNQNSGEKSSAFLSRLHSLLTRVISRGGAAATNADGLLLKQFIRGCWDQSLIIGLQLEGKKGSPPSFPDLLLMLRTEEDRRSAKFDRMKKHLGATKAAAHAHSAFSIPVFDQVPLVGPTSSDDKTVKLDLKINELMSQVEKLSKKERDTTLLTNSPVSPQPIEQPPNETAKLENQIAELTKQVQILVQNQRVTCKSETPNLKELSAVNMRQTQTSARIPGMPRAWFCFKCGEGNHIAAHCTNEPNPTLVKERNAELKKKQTDFAAKQTTAPFALN
ncbi:zinc finger CCHC domain-containing protein 12-like [Hippocampus comes]|uniref:zinc finger CCHC domain-containing protein 12-like n=1 Tax=Hippocampus comes TaxID=109280 RepID=UPI00094E17DD|nr:PREDICTED: zinc finger CCHC domain-containing protein 12-like [Hippocampus comes]